MRANFTTLMSKSEKEYENLLAEWAVEKDPAKKDALQEKIVAMQDTLYQRSTPLTPAGSGKGGPAAGPFEIVERIKKDFDVSASVGPVRERASAAWLPHIQQLEVSGMNAGNIGTWMHEVAHKITTAKDTKFKPGALTPEQREGFKQFDYDPKRVDPILSAQEGFGEYLRLRTQGLLGDLSPEQMAAAKYAEQVLADSGAKAKADNAARLYSEWRSQTPEGIVAGYLSPTGRNPRPADETIGERLNDAGKSAAEFAEETFVDNLVAAARVEDSRVKAGYKPSEPGTDLRMVMASSRRMAMRLTEEINSKGVPIYQKHSDGSVEMVGRGKPVDSYVEGFSREDRQVGGLLDQFIQANHVLDEVAMGAVMMGSENKILQAKGITKARTASPDQIQDYRIFLDKLKAESPEKYEKLSEAAVKYTELHTAANEALVALGGMSRQTADTMLADHPSYVPQYRVLGDSLTKPGKDMGRVGSGRQVIAPSVSLQMKQEMVAKRIIKQVNDNALWDGGENGGDVRGVPGQWKERPDLVKPLPEEAAAEVNKALEAAGYPDADRAEIIASMGEAAQYLKPEPWNAHGKNYYALMADGQPKVVEIQNQALYDLLKNQQAPRLTQMMTAVTNNTPIGFLTKLLRTGATTGSMVFPARAAMRDPFTYAEMEGAETGKGFLGSTAEYGVGLAKTIGAKAKKLAGMESNDPIRKLYDQSVGETVRPFYLPASEGAGAVRKTQGKDAPVKELLLKGAHKVREVLELTGSPEHAGRSQAFRNALLEMGYTSKQIGKAMESNPDLSPVPMNVLFYAMDRAARAQTDFSKKGTWVEQWNKIDPFFGPHIAGMSQEASQWRKAASDIKDGKYNTPVVKAAGGAIGTMLALEAAHWAAYKDEDWYKKLTADQRGKWWVLGQREDGSIWGVPKPHGMLRQLGAYFQESLRSQTDVPRWDLANDTAGDELTHPVLPTGLREIQAIRENKKWNEAPIVPMKAGKPELTDVHQWTRYRLPYLLEQLSGGMMRTDAEGRLEAPKGPQSILDVSKRAPNQPERDAREKREQAIRDKAATK